MAKNGLNFGFRMTGTGAVALGEDDPWAPDGGTVWLDLDRTLPETRRWIGEEFAFAPEIAEALLEEDTRPRCVVRPEGLLLILRGINLDPENNFEETIAVRMWATERRLLTLRRYRVMAVSDLREAVESNAGPATVSDLVLTLAERLTARLVPEIDRMEEQLDGLEEGLLEDSVPVDRAALTTLRRRILILHRYLAPQREALAGLQRGGAAVLADLDPSQLQESLDRVTRLVEELDALRARATIVEEHLALQVAERMNRNMYWLSMVATVFLPVGFVTGLLGVNVGGIPGADSTLGFAALCGLLAVLVGAELWLMKRLRLL